MGYYVEEVSDEESSRNALAEFLAAFVGDGELPRPLEGDEKADIWKKRFSWLFRVSLRRRFSSARLIVMPSWV